MDNRELLGSYSLRNSLNLGALPFQELSSDCKANFQSSRLPLIPSISHDCIYPADAGKHQKCSRSEDVVKSHGLGGREHPLLLLDPF